jgi:hypothetical protein
MWDNETMTKPAEARTDLFDPAQHLPETVGEILNHQTDLPRIAKDQKLIAAIEAKLEQLPTRHDLYHADSRTIDFLTPESIQLVVTSQNTRKHHEYTFSGTKKYAQSY